MWEPIWSTDLVRNFTCGGTVSQKRGRRGHPVLERPQPRLEGGEGGEPRSLDCKWWWTENTKKKNTTFGMLTSITQVSITWGYSQLEKSMAGKNDYKICDLSVGGEYLKNPRKWNSICHITNAYYGWGYILWMDGGSAVISGKHGKPPHVSCLYRWLTQLSAWVLCQLDKIINVRNDSNFLIWCTQCESLCECFFCKLDVENRAKTIILMPQLAVRLKSQRNAGSYQHRSFRVEFVLLPDVFIAILCSHERVRNTF